MVKIRSFFHMSDERITSLKMTCVELSIKYKAIPKEFEVRFLAYLNDDIDVFCPMCPAYLTFFNGLQSSSENLTIMTERFEVTSFTFAIKPVLLEIKILDKSLQSYSLFPDQACEKLDKFKLTVEKESLKEMGSAQSKFYADYELTGVVPEGGKNKQ